MTRRVRYWRRCQFCGGKAFVLLPPGASRLDVEAEFSGQGREFGADDGEPVGVACHSCARVKRHD